MLAWRLWPVFLFALLRSHSPLGTLPVLISCLEEEEFARVQDFVRRPGKAGNWVKATLNGSRHRFLLSQSDFVGKGFELWSLQSRLWCPQDFPERAAIWLV